MNDPHAMMLTEEAAKWLNMAPRTLLAKASGTRAKIPGLWINAREVRFNKLTILAALLRDQGMDLDLIEVVLRASLAQPQPTQIQTQAEGMAAAA